MSTVHGLNVVGFSVVGAMSFLPDAFMSAKNCLRPGNVFTLFSDGYGNESARIVPFVSVS